MGPLRGMVLSPELISRSLNCGLKTHTLHVPAMVPEVSEVLGGHRVMRSLGSQSQGPAINIIATPACRLTVIAER